MRFYLRKIFFIITTFKKNVRLLFLHIYKLFIDPLKFKYNLEITNPYIPNKTTAVKISQIKKYLFKNKKITILEIGTYLGEFTFKLSDYLSSKNIKYKIVTVDPYIVNSFDVNNDYVYKVFRHNLSLNKRSNHIDFFKLKSKDAFKLFLKKKYEFDIIFIDGSHIFDDVMSDLKNSLYYKKKYKAEIFLDDLDFTYEELLNIYKNKRIVNSILKKSIKKDYVKDKVNFHPGTLLAIKKMNLKVSNKKYGTLRKLI